MLLKYFYIYGGLNQFIFMGWKEEKKIKPFIVKEETHGVDTFIEY